jgi:hypothetical protein
MGIKIVVCGGRKFSDLKRLQRALEAIHRKHYIETLITGPKSGAEEMAYFWAVNRNIREIITVPAGPEALTGRVNYQRRNFDLLDKYRPDAVVAFSYPEPDGMIAIAKQHGFRIWEVPADFR